MHKAKNIYFLLIKKKKRDRPRQGVSQGRVPSPIVLFTWFFGDTTLKLKCTYRKPWDFISNDGHVFVQENELKKKQQYRLMKRRRRRLFYGGGDATTRVYTRLKVWRRGIVLVLTPAAPIVCMKELQLSSHYNALLYVPPSVYANNTEPSKVVYFARLIHNV